MLTSCRSTQLANDATVDNGTSHFTQHLVDGLLGAAVDGDGDGYVTFSELYAYVDRRLRETGKQIPQRRVQGDGDLPLATRQQTARAAGSAAVPPDRDTALVARPMSKAAVADSAPAGSPGPAGSEPPAGRPWRKAVLLAAAATVVAAAGAVTAVLLTNGGQSGNPPGGSAGPAGVTYLSPAAFTETSPWRLQMDGRATTASTGCSLWLIDARTGAEISHLHDGLYGISTFQISNTGTFRWGTNDRTCAVTIYPGTGGTGALPLVVPPQVGDTGVFAAPAMVAVRVLDWGGSQGCDFKLYDPDNGALLDFKTITMSQGDTVTLDPYGHKSAYLALEGCGIRISATPA